MSLVLLLAAWAAAAPVEVSTAPAGGDLLEGILKEEGQALAGAFTIKAPQAELRVSADGFPIVPAMGLTTWITLTTAAAHGELVLLEDELGPAQRAALAADFEVTGVESRYLRERPRVLFMSVAARADLETLQEKARVLLEAVSQGRKGKGLQAGPTKAAAAGLDPLALQAILKLRPAVVDNVVRFALPDGGWLAFSGAPDKAAVTGLLRRKSLPGALAAEKIEAAALSDGRLYFWGTGRVDELARALKAVL